MMLVGNPQMVAEIVVIGLECAIPIRRVAVDSGHMFLAAFP